MISHWPYVAKGRRWTCCGVLDLGAGLAVIRHRFRDTFAVELIPSRSALDQVSILLGHSSVKITEKHDAPWVKPRQERLEELVNKTWSA
ncbi:MAG: hypothetical protein AUJ01_00505 [Acidobacteria bacterium 13_1_40CM_3_65_5]|nr:MAG: hypothetical protein AUJ01_00505 [Acidobacteria bacterium 13_1_40CM_3_65_5]